MGVFFPAYELATEMLLLGGMKRDGFQVAVLGHRAPQVVWVEEASVSLLLRSNHVRWRPRRHWLSVSPHRQLASSRRRRRSRRRIRRWDDARSSFDWRQRRVVHWRGRSIAQQRHHPTSWLVPHYNPLSASVCVCVGVWLFLSLCVYLFVSLSDLTTRSGDDLLPE